MGGRMRPLPRDMLAPGREAARYRVRTERESYPATLFNVLSEGPDWFVEAITLRL